MSAAIDEREIRIDEEIRRVADADTWDAREQLSVDAKRALLNFAIAKSAVDDVLELRAVVERKLFNLIDDWHACQDHEAVLMLAFCRRAREAATALDALRASRSGAA